MTIGIAATPQQQQQLITKGIAGTALITWATGTDELLHLHADALIDCTFNKMKLPNIAKPFLFHSPVYTFAELGARDKAGRFCAWNTFLERPLWEIAVTSNENAAWLDELAQVLGWKFCLVEDVPGLVAPRIVSNIINEARHALQAGISSKAEINLAMKLGTAYPYGPFEWESRIGVQNIDALLIKLADEFSFYQPITTKTE